MPTPIDKSLYSLAQKKADEIYRKPSAYKSGFIVKTYKSMGGRYADDNKPTNLKRWFEEKWEDVGHKSYPVYRPTIKVSKKTPLTVEEISKTNLKEQIHKKQIIQGNHNLKPFKRKGALFY